MATNAGLIGEQTDNVDIEREQDELELIRRRLLLFGDRYDREHDNFYYDLGERLRRIGDDLQAHERHDFLSIFKELVFASATGGSMYVAFALSIRKFVLLVADKTRISGDAVKSIIRLFMQIWNDKALSNEIHGLINEHTEDDVPSEVKTMDSEFVTLYHQALSQGYHYVKDIRLMIVGMFGVGKTSLLKNIIYDESEDATYRKSSPESTVGIDVTHCEVLTDGRWRKTYHANYASEKLSNILLQEKKLQDHTDGSTGLAEPLACEYPDHLLNDSQPSEEGTVLYQRDQDTLVHQRNLTDLQSGHSDLGVFMEKLLSVDDIETFRTDVVEKMADSNAHSISEKRAAVWDFAGQNIYYSTHHFFLNGRSIYLLLMNVSKPLSSCIEEMKDCPISGFIHKDFTCLEAFKFWLRSIYMYHSMQDSDISVKPSIILVGTHKDKLDGNDEEKENLKEDFFNEALESFMDSPILKLVRRKKFLVNNLDNKEDYESIRMEVQKTAEEQKYWNEKRPAKWILLERSLEGLKAEGKEIISFDELKKENQKNEMPLKNESDLKLFLHFQNSLGNVLFFETELLQQCIILSPQWIIDAFRCFISHMPDKNPEQLHLWKDYEQRAILTHELIDEIIDNNPRNKCFRDYKKEIVEYMELLDMIARPVDVDHDQRPEDSDIDQSLSERATISADEHHQTGNSFSNESSNLQSKKDFYIVPILLLSRPEEEKMSKWLNPPKALNKTPILAMVFKDGFLPPSVFHRLLAICIRKWQVQKTGNQFVLYNGFAGFRVTRTTTLTIWYQDHIVYGRVCCYDDVSDIKQFCVEARHFLSNSLKSILSIMPNKGGFGEVLLFDEFIQCDLIASFKPGVGLIRLRDFLYHNSIVCEHCEEEHAVSRNEGLGLWADDLLQQQNLDNSTLSDDALCRCLTLHELVQIALSSIGDEYFRLGLELGVNDKRLEQIREVDKYHAPTRIYHVLDEAKRLKERDTADDKLTVKMLRNGLIAVGGDVSAYDKLLNETVTEAGNTDDGTDNDCPTATKLSKLSECIGDEYWLLGIILGIPEVRMQQLREAHRKPPVRNYYVLLEWMNRDNNVCTRTILNAMKLVGSDHEKAKNILLN